MKSDTPTNIRSYLDDVKEKATMQSKEIKDELKQLDETIFDLNKKMDEAISTLNADEYHNLKEELQKANDKKELYRAKHEKMKNIHLISEDDYKRYVHELTQYEQNRLDALRDNTITRMRELNEMYLKEAHVLNEVDQLIRELHVHTYGQNPKLFCEGFKESDNHQTISCLGHLINCEAGKSFLVETTDTAETPGKEN